MRRIILFIVLFEISSCATPFTHGNIAFDHVSSSFNIVSKDSIFVSARLMSPAEANEVFCGKFVRYDHTVAKTQIYVPITNIQPCVLSILNNGNDTITFKATDTNNYVGRDAIQNCLTFRDQSAGGLLVCSGLLFVVLSPSLATAAPVSLVMGAFFLAGGIGTISQEDQKEKDISQYLKTISPDVLKIAPYQEKQIVIFRQNSISPNILEQSSNIFTEKKQDVFIDKTQSDILKLNFVHKNWKTLQIEMPLKS